MNKTRSDLKNTEISWASSDPLGEALHVLHMNGVFYTRSELTAPWGLTLPSVQDCLMFHVVTSGSGWIVVKGEEPRLLKPGQFALVPRGQGHQLLSEQGAAAIDLLDLPREKVSERYEILRHGNGGEMTTLICGAVDFQHPAAHHLISLLPGLMCIDTWHSPQMEWFQSTLRLMTSEADEMRPGGETMITRLADILVIQAIRSWMSDNPAAQTGWLGALQDKQIGRAILAIQREPDHEWTVELLADEVAMSRSAFAARFTKLIGETPMKYLLNWRMNVALTWLKERELTVAELACRLGYQSEAAFSRAFKRAIGVSPGQVSRNTDSH